MSQSMSEIENMEVRGSADREREAEVEADEERERERRPIISSSSSRETYFSSNRVVIPDSDTEDFSFDFRKLWHRDWPPPGGDVLHTVPSDT